MNNVGEFFFSRPIDPFDLSTRTGAGPTTTSGTRSSFNGAVNTSMAPATTAWQHLTHGFQVSGLLQAYSAPPFNITSGVTTMQGTAGRPIVDGEFIARNAGVGSDFFSLSAARQPRVPRERPRDESRRSPKCFNLTNRRNELDAQHQLRRWRISDEPVADIQPDHRRRRAAQRSSSALRVRF